jgi:CubicO group peptidase (beta-lactamase class C family)
MRQHRVPTVGYCRIENGKLQPVQVLGQLPSGAAAPSNTLFNVASLTKPLTALVALQLVNQGQWTLDEPLATYWVDPEVQADPRAQQLTSRHVLSHQSGFANWRWQETNKHLSFHFEPGRKWQYSGEGYEYLRQALERKFHRPLNVLADSLLFQPLGMQDTRYCWTKTMDEARFAGTYTKDAVPYEVYRNPIANAANWVLSTVHDYGLFGEFLLQGARLQPALFEQMAAAQAPVLTAKHVAWGLGWAVVGGLPNHEYALFHGGGGQGVNTVVLLLPKSGRGLVVFTNSDNGQEVYKRLIRASLDVGGTILQRFEP